MEMPGQEPRPHAERPEATDEKRGKLKIFFGYAAGVGKTYAMLQAAHQAKARGVDVYELFDKLYEKSFKDFKNESPSGDYLNRIRLIVNAKISVVKK